MTPRERVLAALNHQIPDRVPRFEIWIDGLIADLGLADSTSAYASLGQDCVMMPSVTPPRSNAWRTGVDEWGRVWQDGVFVRGRVDDLGDLDRYSPTLDYVEALFDDGSVRKAREQYGDRCLIFGSHIGPFTAGYMAMGFEPFLTRLVDDPDFVRELLDRRTNWCIALFRKAASLGAEVLILGDDAAHTGGPMVSPQMWRQFILPLHRRIVESATAPVIWHSDGNVASLIPMAIEAGFVGIHGLEPAAGMDLAEAKEKWGSELVLVGNIDVRALCEGNLAAVRTEVDRCLAAGAPGGGYMIATCNSIFDGLHPGAVREMFRYESEVGAYEVE